MTFKKMTGEDKKTMLEIARSAIGSALGKCKTVKRPVKVSDALARKRGCFVTLNKNGTLRGCIGTIEPLRPLIEGVEKNAVNAAFKDLRFKKLTCKELDEVDIEISALTVPETVEFKNNEDLLKKIKAGVHGVIISRGERIATFLPQVWQQFSGKKEFLGALCQKAGIESSCWKNQGIEVKVYEAEYFSEHEMNQL